jgi:Mor family transcriptional regulator
MGIWDKLFGNTQPADEPVQNLSVRKPYSNSRAAKDTRNARIREDYEAGMKTVDIAEKYLLSTSYIHQLCKDLPRRYRVPIPHKRPMEIVERNLAMVAAYESGEENLQSLGDKYGVSRERVRQILAPVGSTALVKEQRRIRREEAQAAAAELKAAVRAERAAKIAEAVEIVRQGFSINEARRRVPGLPINGLQLECKKVGVESSHGRWRDFGPKIARARELRATGLSWGAISNQLGAEGFGKFGPNFVTHHMPDLVERRTQHTNGAGSVAQPPREPAAPKPRKVYVDPESIWTDDAVARLKIMWFNGNTAQQCADILGQSFTRNAIIGKVNRLRAAGELKP